MNHTWWNWCIDFSHSSGCSICQSCDAFAIKMLEW